MTVFHSTNDYLEISYQPTFRMLVGRWLRLVSDAEALQGYSDLLAAARQYDAHYWLLDIRRRDRNSPTTQHWLLASYYPQLVSELGAPIRLVYFMAPALREEFLQDNTMPELGTYGQHEAFRMNQCITEAESVAWLQAEQKRAAG